MKIICATQSAIKKVCGKLVQDLRQMSLWGKIGYATFIFSWLVWVATILIEANSDATLLFSSMNRFFGFIMALAIVMLVLGPTVLVAEYRRCKKKNPLHN